MIVLLWQQGHGWRPYLPWTASLCTSVYNEQYVIILFLLQTARNQVRGTPETMPSPAEGCPWSEVECDWSEVYFDLYLVSCFFLVDDGCDDNNLPSLSVLHISWGVCYMYSLSWFMCCEKCIFYYQHSGIKVLFFYIAFMLGVDAMMQVLLELLSRLLVVCLTLG